MKSSTSFCFSSLLFFFFIVASMDVYSEALTCTYKLTVQTGESEDPDAGTNSRISVTLGNSAGQRLEIPDLKEWGSMLPDHNYFQSGNRDLFAGKSDCFNDTAPVCSIIVTSDGSGEKPEWFLEEVEVTTYVGPYIRASSINFNFSKWLAKDELTASVDNCDSSTSYSASF